MANQFLSQISLGTQAVLIYTGNGSPEGVETAPVGSVYLNATASNASNTLYVKGSGTGNTGWALLAASTIPAGSDTEIQFNDAGVSAGDPQLTWNKTTNTITIGSTNNAGTILVKDQGEIRFEEDNPNGTSYISLKAPASIASNVSLTLPSELPGSSSGFLVGNSTGSLSFATTSALLYNETTGGVVLTNTGNSSDFFVVRDSLPSKVFSIGSDIFGNMPRFYTDFVINYSTRMFTEYSGGEPTEILTLYGDDFYFGPYDKNGTLGAGLNVYIRYGRGNAGSNSAITLSGIDYYIDIPLAIISSPPAKSGATNPKLLSISGTNANHTTVVAGDINDIVFNLNRNVQFTTGSTISAIRAFYVNPPTYIATAATQTITHASTLSISGAPARGTNVAITNTSAFRIEAGAVSTATNSYGLYVDLQTGATNNYGAYIAGRVGINNVSPAASLDSVAASSSTVAGRFSGESSQSANILEVATKTNNVWLFNSLANVVFTPEAQTSGSPVAFTMTGAAHTGLTASTEVNDINFNLARTVQFSTGALTTQRAIRIQPPTYAFVASSTITTASTVSIGGAPVAGTNAAITNSYALNIESGKLQTAATTTTTAGLNLPHGTAPSSPVNGDIWTTTAGLYARINGSTVGPYGTGGGGSPGGSNTHIQYNNSGSFAGSSDLTWVGGSVARVNINSTNNAGIGLYESSSLKWTIATYSSGTFTFYNETLLEEAIGITSASIITMNRKVGVGITPTAYFHVKAGTATANTAPIKLTSGTNLTAIEAGVFEYDGSALYFSPTSSIRHVVTPLENSPATITSNQNDYAIPNASFIRLTVDALRTITGFAGGYAGRRITVKNASVTFSISFSNQSASSSAVNRFVLNGGMNKLLLPGQSCSFIYDGTTQRWLEDMDASYANLYRDATFSSTVTIYDSNLSLYNISTGYAVIFDGTNITNNAGNVIVRFPSDSLASYDITLLGYKTGSPALGTEYLPFASNTQGEIEWRVISSTDLPANVAYLDVAQTFTASQVFRPTTSATLGLVVRGVASQSANLQEWQTNTPTTVASISANGDWIVAPIVRTTGSPTLFRITGPAHTTLTSSTEATDINFNLARTVQFSTGALTTQRAMRIQAPTYAFVASSTITTASTVSISGAPVAGTNATITNSYALNIESGQIATPVGSNTAPSYTISGDSNTGMYSNGADTLDFATGGTNRLRLDSTGNILVNSASALGRISVAHSTNTSGISFQAGSATWAIWLGSETIPYFYIAGSGGTSQYFWRANWNATSDAANTFKSASDTTNQVVMEVRGASAQTAILQQWTRAGTLVSNINSHGDWTINPAARTTGSPNLLLLTAPAHTGLTASTEASDIYFNLARIVGFSAGALTTQRAIRITAPTYLFTSSSTISDASTVAISGPPIAGINATITRSYALSIESGAIALRNEGSLHMFESIGLGTHRIIFKAATDLSSDSTYSWPVKATSTPIGSGQNVLTSNSGNLAWTTLTNAQLGTQIYNEIPSGAINGSNVVFYTANGIEPGTLRVYKNGLRQAPGSGYDYTVSGQEITFESGNVPQTGDVILVDYVFDGLIV